LDSLRTAGAWLALTLAAAAALALLTVPGARAATVTIGSPLTGTFSSTDLGVDQVTWTNVALPPGETLASPVDGTIRRWRMIGPAGGPFRLRVLTPAGGTSYTGAGTGPPQTPTTNGTQIFPADLPINAGQIVGFDNLGTTDKVGVQLVTGATYTDWNPALADGESREYTNPYGGGAELGFNADVRYCVVPALAGKKLGAAKQALTAADCALGKITRPKKKAKRKKAKFVRGQSAAPGSSISDTAPIDLRLGKKPGKKRKR
jgi:hypothetical protein